MTDIAERLRCVPDAQASLGVQRLAREAADEIERLRRTPSPEVGRSMETAPRDGSMFLSWDPRINIAQPTMRRVRFVADLGGGKIDTIDMGAWLFVAGIDQDWQERDTSGDVEWSVAPDEYNKRAPRLWAPLPSVDKAPSPEATRIRLEALEEAAGVARQHLDELSRVRAAHYPHVQIGSHIELCEQIEAAIRSLKEGK